jgi:hypothetical protein
MQDRRGLHWSSGEVPNYYAACPNRVTYVLFPLPGGPSGISALSQEGWDCVRAVVKEHINDGKILVHCVEGRHRSELFLIC